YDIAGIDFVIVSNFAGVQPTSAGNLAVEIIGVGSAESRNRTATLCPGSSIKAMGMNDPTDFMKRTIENKMSCSIRAGLQITFNDFSSLKRNHDHVPGFHRRV